MSSDAFASGGGEGEEGGVAGSNRMGAWLVITGWGSCRVIVYVELVSSLGCCRYCVQKIKLFSNLLMLDGKGRININVTIA